MDMADHGLALPDGSYPIKDEADLKNAIQAYGRAKDKERAKAHIIKRARALGLADLIPEEWMQTDDTKGGPSLMYGNGNDEMTPDKFRKMRMAMMGDAENAAEDAAPDEEMPEEEAMGDAPKKKAVVKIGADGEVKSCAKGLGMGQCGYKAGSKVCGKCGAMAVEVKKPMAEEMGQDAEDEMMDEEKQKSAWYDDMRIKRLQTLEESPETTDVFVCAKTRKMLHIDDDVCGDCRGGCAPEGDLPGLLEAEGIALSEVDGKVLESGFSVRSNSFLLTMQRKSDGEYIAAYVDGYGNFRGWHVLTDEVLKAYGVKSAESPEFDPLTIDDATRVAIAYAASPIEESGLGMVDAKALAVDAEIMDGYDIYAVEVQDVEGKSADVFVTIDGTVLGHDTFGVEAFGAKADLIAALAEFDMLVTETELRDQGLL